MEASLQVAVGDRARHEIGGIAIIKDRILVSDVVDGKLVNRYASVVATNVEDERFTIDSIGAISRHHIQFTVVNITLASGQSRPSSSCWMNSYSLMFHWQGPSNKLLEARMHRNSTSGLSQPSAADMDLRNSCSFIPVEHSSMQSSVHPRRSSVVRLKGNCLSW